ncbi:MAG: class I SAM-dependent methyltransferase [Streptococcaceae bacterium]|nr:class I SAM-dependent methyltransferase [Streptococcaceae bacterium]MCL2681025.1 class I SAM-dependent methyltransferase [Streptococcaceae bacterium]MCL2858362.1 class I SAM-dependent methyltransferase [Streptococcaceae bacterium]
MTQVKLSKRLQMIADLVPENKKLLDVGSDHAHLPVYLLQKDKITSAIAGEVAIGPYETARDFVKEQEFTKNIHVRLADGLSAFEPSDQVESIVIAGMGGQLIAEILEAGKEKLSSVSTLILQPNNHEDTVRQWLQDNEFKIVQEKILSEAWKFYEILLVQQGQMNLSEKELRFGQYLMTENSSIFQSKWKNKREVNENILSQLMNSKEDEREKMNKIKHQIALIKEILNEN